MSRPSFIQRKLAARRLWQELAPLASEIVTSKDAENIGRSAEWFAEAIMQPIGVGDSVPIAALRAALEDEGVVDLIRYKGEVAQIEAALAGLSATRFSPYDAVAAGVVGREFLDVCRMLFPNDTEVCLGHLVPQIRRPAVRELFGAGSPSAVRNRISRIQEAAAVREMHMQAAAFALDREVDLQAAQMSGAADPETRALVDVWFGRDVELNVGTLLQVPQMEAFARLAQWRIMMATA